MTLSVVPGGLAAFSAANAAAGAAIDTAGSVDGAANLAAAAAALGPIGSTYLAAYGPAQTNCIAATQEVGALHAAIGAATDAASASFVATDQG